MNKFYEYIEDYLEKKMTESEIKAFEEAMLNDSLLQSQVSAQKEVRMLLQQSSLRKKVEKNLNLVKEKEKKPMMNVFYLQKAAAIIGFIFTIGLIYWYTSKSDNTQVLVHVDNSSEKPTLPKVEQSKEKDWLIEPKTDNQQNQIADAPKSKFHEPQSQVRSITKDENKGEKILKKYLENIEFIASSNQTDSIHYNQGLNALKQKKYQESIRYFSKIQEDSPIHGETQWYYVLSLIAMNRYDSAKNILNEISDDNQNKHQKEAKELLEKL